MESLREEIKSVDSAKNEFQKPDDSFLKTFRDILGHQYSKTGTEAVLSNSKLIKVRTVPTETLEEEFNL